MSQKKPSYKERKSVQLDFSDHQMALDLYEEAFEHPECLYEVTPTDVEVARAWISDNAYMINFGWTGARAFQEKLKELGAMHYGQEIDMDTLYYRDRCGWVTSSEDIPDEGADNNGYLCDYPPEKGDDVCSVIGKRLCYACQCPIAVRATDENEDDMILYRRPRYAYVANVVVKGCEQIFG